MRIAITGASGLIGRALTTRLEADGHEIVRLVRRPVPADSTNEVRWDPAAGTIDAARLEGLGAAIHLAGENVAAGRWSDARKAAILRSRVGGTRLLAGALAAAQDPPACLLTASATGYYGDRGDEILTEASPPGRGFLADTCRRWEHAADVASDAGVRVVRLRLGVVLAPSGGALSKLLPPFRLGLGGRIGDGRQYFPWIAMPDVVGGFRHALEDETIEGVLNLVAPESVTNAAFTRALGGVLSRPTPFPIPAFALRLALGEMADEMLLAGQRVVPEVLTERGYVFEHPTLEPTLSALLEG